MLYFHRETLSSCARSATNCPVVQDWPAIMAKRAGDARHAALKNFYLAGAPAPDTPVENIPLLAMDFETTGLNAWRDDIVSIGLIPVNLERIRLRDSQHWILNPRADLRKESIIIHGITHSAIAHAPDLSEVLIKLLAMMAGKVMVVHHKGIEQHFLDMAFKKRIGEGIVFPCIDTLLLEARLIKEQRNGGWLKKIWRPKPHFSLRLAESRARYNLPHYMAHNALTDALGCAELFQAQISHYFSSATPIGELWG